MQGDVLGHISLPDPARQDEGQGAGGHFLVLAHVVDEFGGGGCQGECGWVCGQAGLGEVGFDAGGVIGGAEAVAGGEIVGESHAEGDGFAVEELA